jgi:hypothetical protein
VPLLMQTWVSEQSRGGVLDARELLPEMQWQKKKEVELLRHGAPCTCTRNSMLLAMTLLLLTESVEMMALDAPDEMRRDETSNCASAAAWG